MEWSIEVVQRIEADRDQIFELLTDYANLADWLPGMTSARELAREGGVVVVEFIAPALAAPSLVLELVHSPPVAAQFMRVDQYRGEETSGSWELADVEGGVELRVRLRPGRTFAGARGRKRLRAGIERALEAIGSGLEARLSGHEPETDDGGRRKVLEVTRHGNKVIVWHRGRLFELNPRTEND